MSRQNKSPTIRLYEAVGLGLIIEDPSGVSYSNQTGGTACLQSAAVGFYVPLRSELVGPERVAKNADDELLAYFEGPKHRGAG